jgi:endonuclease/exonuclease/phosphatase (EEP) superfamily protein YafD
VLALRRRGRAALNVRSVDRLLPLAAGGVLAATLLSFAARAWWGFELLTHFRLQLFAAALVLMAVSFLRPRASSRVGVGALGAAATRGRHALPAALAVAAVINGAPLARYAAPTPSFAAPTPAGTSAALAVLSVNVRWSNDSYARLLDIVDKENPDAVVVVELTPAWREGLARLDAQYPYKRLAPRLDAYGVGLWSRYPFERSAEVALESAAAIDARLATPTGTVRLIGVHLRSPTTGALAAERNRQYGELTHLAGTTGAEPLVIVGDFNTTPYSPIFSDWLAASHLRDVRAGLDITWPTYLPFLGIPIDHCVVNAKIEAASFQRLRAFGSDHYPILCRLEAVVTGGGA